MITIENISKIDNTNLNTYSCPKCNSDKSRKNGIILKSGSRKYQRLQCTDCGCCYQGELIPKKPL